MLLDSLLQEVKTICVFTVQAKAFLLHKTFHKMLQAKKLNMIACIIHDFGGDIGVFYFCKNEIPKAISYSRQFLCNQFV